MRRRAEPVAFCGACPKIASQEPEQRPPPQQGARHEAQRRAASSLRRTGLRLFPQLLLGGRDRAAARSKPRTFSSSTARKSGARRPARRAPPSPRTPSARCSACWRAIRAWSNRCCNCSARSVYVHQFKLNAKAAFEGDVWQWHQDYGTWQRDDGMPDARAMNIAVFLDEVMPINGPLMLIPKSHKQGVLRRRPRQAHHVLSAVDARQGDGDAARRRGGRATTASASWRPPASPARC